LTVAPAPATAPTLHLPDEPTARADLWLAAIAEGADLGAVLAADDGLIEWLWARWSTLARSGLSHGEFTAVALDYRRELWLWLAGERTWSQACSGLVGRIIRRVAQAGAAGG
jgi:hypothetical protein